MKTRNGTIIKKKTKISQGIKNFEQESLAILVEKIHKYEAKH